MKIQKKFRQSTTLSISDVADSMHCSENLLNRVEQLTRSLETDLESFRITANQDAIGNFEDLYCGRFYSVNGYTNCLWVGVLSDGHTTGNIVVGVWSRDIESDVKGGLESRLKAYCKSKNISCLQSRYVQWLNGSWAFIDTEKSLLRDSDIVPVKDSIVSIIKDILNA